MMEYWWWFETFDAIAAYMLIVFSISTLFFLGNVVRTLCKPLSYERGDY